VIGIDPPFSLARPAFRFRALANLAARAPLGGEREMALAALMAARLSDGVLLATPLTAAARASRAAGAKLWCSTLTLPAAARTALGRVVDATEIGERPQVAGVLSAFAIVAGSALDAPSRAELADLVTALTSG